MLLVGILIGIIVGMVIMNFVNAKNYAKYIDQILQNEKLKSELGEFEKIMDEEE